MLDRKEIELEPQHESFEEIDILEERVEQELIHTGDELDPGKYLCDLKVALIFPWVFTGIFSLCYQIPVWVNPEISKDNKPLEDALSNLHWLTFCFFIMSLATNAWILHPILKLPSTQACGIAFQNIFTSIKNYRNAAGGLINEDRDDTTDAELEIFRKVFHKSDDLTDENDLLASEMRASKPGYGSIREI